MTFGNLNAVFAADYYDYLFSDNNNTAVSNPSNVVIIPDGYNKTDVTEYTKTSENNYDGYITPNTQIYIDDIEDTEECYKGSVKYAPQPVPTTAQSPLNNNTSTNTKEKKSGTFSENHPVLTGLGMCILIAGMVMGAVMLDTDADDDDCNHCRHHHKHHNHHNSHSNHVCDTNCR